MPRYFIEVAYKGDAYSGFQVQHNANTIQSELEKAWSVLHKQDLSLTGSSRTDAGVHALQNYFHFDTEFLRGDHLIYQLNAILPFDIVVKSIRQVADDAHCRFDATAREYKYFIYQRKDPFVNDRAFFFPYKLDIEKMHLAAEVIMEYNDFTSFSKRNTQVKSFICTVLRSEWIFENGQLVYNVKANRFLRGMVRALTATMLKVGRGKLGIGEFRQVIEGKDCTMASFAVPAHGLFLVHVEYPTTMFEHH